MSSRSESGSEYGSPFTPTRRLDRSPLKRPDPEKTIEVDTDKFSYSNKQKPSRKSARYFESDNQDPENTRMASSSRSTSTATDSLQDEVKALLAQGETEIDKLIPVVSYSGFDPNIIRAVLRSCEKNREQYVKDISTLITIFLLRGTNLPKIASKSGEEGARIISELQKKYKVQVPGSRIERKTITMARIAQCYPEVVLNYLRTKPELVKRPTGFPDAIPDSFCTTVAASVIPKNEGGITRALLNTHLAYLVALDEMVNPNDPTDVNQIKQYQMAAHNSNMFTEQERMNLCEDLDWLAVGDNGLTVLNESFMPYMKSWDVDYYNYKRSSTSSPLATAPKKRRI